MSSVKIICPKCSETILVSYPTTFGHVLTEEALAIDRAMQKHICPTFQERQACESRNELK